MRVPVVVLFCLLFLRGPAAAEDEKKEEPGKPATEMTEAEREAALEKAKELNGRVVSLWRAGKFREAEPLAREALRIREEVLGPDHPEVAQSLLNLGAQLIGQGRHEEVRPLYERSLKIREEALGPWHPDVALSLNNLATLFHTLGAYDEARPLYERALRIREKALGPDHPHVVQSLNNLASLLQRQGAYEEARPLCERALRISEEALGSDHPRMAQSLNNLATLLQRQGAYEEARPLFERALKIAEKALGPDHPRVALRLNNLAVLVQRQGAYEEARPLYERALQIRERALGPKHPDVAASLNNLAWLLHTLGAYEEARPLYERSLEIREKALGPEHPHVALTLANLAALLETLGAHEEALPLCERALKIHEKALGHEHPMVATSLTRLASVLQAQGAYEAARPLHERALKIREVALGLEHPDVATSLSHLAMLLEALGAYEEARPFHQRALMIYEKALGPGHTRVAAILNNLAWLLGKLGAYEEARQLFERALKIKERALGTRHPRVATSLSNLAWLYETRGQHERAAPLLARCLDIVEHHLRRNLAGLQASERLALMRSLRFYLANSLRVAPHLGHSGQAEVLRFKGLLARVATAERRLARADGADATERVTALRAAERRVAKLANSMPSFRDKAKKAAWQKAYAKAATKREELALALARDFAPLRAGLERLDLKLPDIQAQLGIGEALLDFLRSGDKYLVWVTRQEGKPQRIELGEADAIEAAAAAFAKQAADSDDSGWRNVGKSLRDLVFTRIGKHLGPDIQTIYICPDAALAAVPFASLPGKTDGGVLIDDYLVSTVSMAQDLVPWKDEPEPSKGALLLGGVDYGEAAVGEQEEASRPRALVDRAPRGRTFTRLPGTKPEANTISMQLGKDVNVLIGQDATEARFRSLSAGRRVLHLATHGFVRDDLMRGLTRRNGDREWLGTGMERQLAQGHDPMLLAGLAMAGANPREGGHDDDGILTALEASHLDLDGVELVVLSACQTALGTAESGEGVIGLVRGFQMAGAKRVIGSLWKVDDAATKAVMVKFYELWSPKEGKGIGAAAALRKAQAYVRSQPKWKHPYYWAAWVLWGLPN